MRDKTRSRVSTAALILGFAALCAIIVLTALYRVGTDDALYYAHQTLFDALSDRDIEVSCGISREDLRRLDRSLSDYLKGDRAALDITVSVNGVPRPAFNERETAHMADCFELFALLRRVRSRLIPWAILLTLGGAWLSQDRRRIRRCAWIAPLLILLPLGGFAVYALLDFDAAFVTFHHLLFTNDLWLLNPETDLLIRICPEGMFRAMGIKIAVYSLLGMLAIAGVVTLLTRFWPRQRGKNTWKTTTRRGSAPRQYTFGSKGTR